MPSRSAAGACALPGVENSQSTPIRVGIARRRARVLGGIGPSRSWFFSRELSITAPFQAVPVTRKMPALRSCKARRRASISPTCNPQSDSIRTIGSLRVPAAAANACIWSIVRIRACWGGLVTRGSAARSRRPLNGLTVATRLSIASSVIAESTRIIALAPPAARPWSLSMWSTRSRAWLRWNSGKDQSRSARPSISTSSTCRSLLSREKQQTETGVAGV